MALKTCKECGNRVSSKARKCPRCGAPIVGAKVGCVTGCFLAVLVPLAIVLFCSVLMDGDSGPGPQARLQSKEKDLIHYARTIVRKGLKSPSSARFPLPEDPSYGVTDVGGGRHVVTGYVDAKNAFGVVLRHRWTVELELLPGDKFRATYIEIGGEVVYGSRQR